LPVEIKVSVVLYPRTWSRLEMKYVPVGYYKLLNSDVKFDSSPKNMFLGFKAEQCERFSET
jgi:hypothetical protein